MSEQQQYTVSIDLEIIDEQQTELLIEKIGPRGPIGVTPDIQIGTVTTLDAGASATATMTGSAEEPLLNLGIPQGLPGVGAVVDDTSGIGDTDKVWSADKTASELAEKSGVIFKTISTPAAVQTFDDGADNLPVKQMQIAIEPVQDLHGYDHPWPAGGGKNLLPYRDDMANATVDGITYTINKDADGNVISITANGTATQNTLFHISNRVTFPAGSYILSGCPRGGGNPGYMLFDRVEYFSGYEVGNGISATQASEHEIWIAIRITSGVTVNNVVFKPMIRLASDTDATFAPYSNICPISGWTGANVRRTGINIWDEEWEVGTILPTTGENGTSSTAIRSKNYIPVLPLTNYYCYAPSGYTTGRVAYYDENKTYLGNYPIGWDTLYNNNVFTTKANAYFMRFAFVATTYNNDISINYPSTDTQYHPGQVEQIEYTFPSSAGTVYGGELTVNRDGTGTLVVDRASVDLGTLSWNRDTTTRPADGATIHAFFATVNDCKIITNIPNMLSSVFRADTITDTDYGGYTVIKDFLCSGADGNHRIWVYGSIYNEMSTSEFATAMSGVQLVYELATPVTYTLTAPQVKTLLGLNNIWADTGNVNSITYRTDENINYEIDRISGRVDNTQDMIAPAETLTATSNHAIRDIFVCGDQLLRATAAIASGETLTIGTNVVVTSIAEELAALWAAVNT